ncbi:MAG TPA: copper chaperone PCu(A)C [Aestuariivirga sp.]|nr:copper chaperone PCu(A)C [Aestuariivirga sp.]
MVENEAEALQTSRRVFLIACLLAPRAAFAHSFSHGNIAIGHAWALPSNQNDGQVFFPLVNNGDERDELVAARSDVCGLIELRQNNRYDDPPLAAMALEPGKPVPMRPTARHLRLVGLKQPLRIGESFAVILDFLNAGEVEIEAMVEEKPGT